VLQTNTKLERVELKGLVVRSKFTLNKLKPYMSRLVL